MGDDPAFLLGNLMLQEPVGNKRGARHDHVNQLPLQLLTFADNAVPIVNAQAGFPARPTCLLLSKQPACDGLRDNGLAKNAANAVFLRVLEQLQACAGIAEQDVATKEAMADDAASEG